MDLEIICDEGICYMALCNNNTTIMTCGSITNIYHSVLPNNNILLNKYNAMIYLSMNIIL